MPELNFDGGPVASSSQSREVELTAIYHDTADLRLARAGITLRHRVGDGAEGWELKIPVLGLRSYAREEIHVAGAAGVVPERLAHLVTAYARNLPLEPRATLRTERTTRDLLSADGRVLAEIVDDRVDAYTDEQPAAQFREIEVEDRGGGSAVLDLVGAQLRDAGAVTGEFQPKVVRALGHQATAPADPPAPLRPGPRDPARVLVTAVLRTHVRRLVEHDVGVRLDAFDALHQMRVDARRLRAALRDLGPLLDQVEAGRLLEELQWVGTALSGSRDAEVVEARLEQALSQLPADAVVDKAHRLLGEQFAADRDAAREPMAAMLTSERYVALLNDLIDAATHPRTNDRADRPCSEVVPPLLRASWRRLANRVSTARTDGADPAAYHRVRIAAKRTRYLVGALEDVYGKPARRLEKRLQTVQDVLGEHQDAQAAGAALLRAAATPRAGRAAFTFGVLYAMQERAAARTRAEFDDLWPRVAKRKVRRWVEDPDGR